MKTKERFHVLTENAMRTARANWLLGLVLAVFFAVQLLNINNAPWEKYDSWRQTDTYTIAQNYVQFNMNPFRPQFNYDGAGENFVQLELQIMPWLSSIVYQLLGSEPFAVPRLISLIMFIGSAIFVYAIAKKFFSNGASLGAATVYLFLPISVMYSRAIMPEAAALLFYTAAIFWFLEWFDTSSIRALFGSAVCTAIAIMEKTPIVFIGIMFIVLFFKKEKSGAFKKPYFYGFGAISIGIPIVYYLYSSSVATFNFVDNITKKHVFKDFFTAVFTPQAKNFFINEAPKFFGITVLFLAVFGLICIIAKKNLPLMLWTGSMVLETITIVAIIRFGYYLVFLAPLVAVLCGSLFHYVGKKIAAAGLMVTVAGVLLAMIATAQFAWPYFEVDDKTTQIASEIKSVAKQDDIIATATGDPVLLGAANRRGFRANLKHYDYIPQEPQAEIDYFIAHGVRYFVVVDNKIPNDGGEYLQLLKENYASVAGLKACEIFDLEAANK